MIGKPEYVPGQYRDELGYYLIVDILLKKNQKTGIRTRGKIERILTNKKYHPRGCKVLIERLDEYGSWDENGSIPQSEYVGRVIDILGYEFDLK